MPTVPVRASWVSGGVGGGEAAGGAGARAGRATRFLARTWISGRVVAVGDDVATGFGAGAVVDCCAGGVASGFGAGAAFCAAAVVTNISDAKPIAAGLFALRIYCDMTPQHTV